MANNTDFQNGFAAGYAARAKGAGSLEQVQADYTQNDNTAVDYIQNRPFYEEISGNYTPLMENQPVLFNEGYIPSHYDNGEYNSNKDILFDKLRVILDNNLGNVLTIQIKNPDGSLYTERSGEVVEALNEKDKKINIIGNHYFYTGNKEDDTGEDFYFLATSNEFAFDIRKDYFETIDEDGYSTIEFDYGFLNGDYLVDILVGDVSTKIKKLDTKFINTTNEISENSTDNEIPTALAITKYVNTKNPEQTQSNYEENDATSKSYIQNRPFYAKVGTTPITETFYDSLNGDPTVDYVEREEFDSIQAVLTPSTSVQQQFKEGAEITCTFEVFVDYISDGGVHSITRTGIVNKYSDELLYVGDAWLVEENRPAYGEPEYAITYNTTTNEITIYVYTLRFGAYSGANITLSSSYIKEEIKQLDPRYIPDYISKTETKNLISEVPEQIQSNYEENDKTSKSYILNRPFYTELTLSKETVYNSPTATYDYNVKRTQVKCDPIIIPNLDDCFTVGNTMDIILEVQNTNGETGTLSYFEKEVKKYSSVYVPYVGGWNIVAEGTVGIPYEDEFAVTYSDTGELRIYLSTNIEINGYPVAECSNMNVTLILNRHVLVDHQLDPKYIPDYVSKTEVSELINSAIQEALYVDEEVTV